MDKFQRRWPWGLGFVAALLYGTNPEPFEEAASTGWTRFKRPVLRGAEWLEYHDVDPDSMALEFPVDRIFGPLELSQQMDFLIGALKDDNELADGYLTRIIIDHTDISLDPPPLGDALTRHRGQELLEFAINDFTGKRFPRKNAFFNGDQFLRTANILANQPDIAKWFINTQDGVSIVFRALSESKEEYARVLATRILTVAALSQDDDGTVEKKILEGDFVPNLLECYRACTGDPTDTRFVTLLLSSMLRHYPEQAARDFDRCRVVQTAIEGLNISRYKGLPQHYRVLQDMVNLPPAVKKKVGIDVAKDFKKYDLAGVGSGVLGNFPEYMEADKMLLGLWKESRKEVKPLTFVEFDVLNSINKVFRYYTNNFHASFYERGSLGDQLSDFVRDLAKDEEFQFAVSAEGPENIQRDWRRFTEYEAHMRSEQEKREAELKALEEPDPHAADRDALKRAQFKQTVGDVIR